MHQLVAAYKDAYERDLEADIIGDTSGHFQKMLVVLLQGTREEDDVVSEDLVQQDAQDLYEAGELKWGTDEAQFIYILGNRSKQHLRLVFDEYLKTTGKPIEASIRGELSGDFEKLMLAVVKCIRSTPEYFAERLFKAMKVRGRFDVKEVGGGSLCPPHRDSWESPVVHWPKEAFKDWPQVRVRTLCPRAPEPGMLPGHTPSHPNTCPDLMTDQRVQ
uniref:Annexin n=1 Tax=Molossus molossus TaxID=27622 RepID=A0A7J8I4V2_MOLMO|nr:annexin A6 [Molossus molossus]